MAWHNLHRTLHLITHSVMEEAVMWMVLAAERIPTRVRLFTVDVALSIAVTAHCSAARADEGGVGSWLPGSFGSLAATPLQPGWSLGLIYLHADSRGGGDVAASRTLRFPNRTVNLNVSLDASLRAELNVGVFAPSYVFATPVFGGQLSINVLALYGDVRARIDASLAGTLGPIGFATERSIFDDRTIWGDVFIQPTWRINQGVHNYIAYAMTNLPVGAYDSTRLSNLGLGHWFVDAGGGYTYLNPHTGWEFSAVTGFSYNFINPQTQYRNGIDWHLDWGVSHFVSKQMHVGLVGYAYQQLTGDSGSGATLGDFKSRVLAVGPQVGFLFPVGDKQGYLNLKAYKEFAAEHRAEGWNAWITFAISNAADPPPAARPRIPLK
jgi:hypothetical protein